ncbi:MAG: HlyC/CorC family transporter [Clostridia bacterium]|nr:HlyC/CorC family transporter [Clostridia bacterium]
MDYFPQILAMAICIILSAYFSATETAFSSLNKTRIKTLAEKGEKRAILTEKLSDKYEKLLSTILVGNNIVNIAVASIGTLLFTAILSGNADLGATVSTIVVTVVVLIFGEITPKTAAKNNPEAFAMFSAPIINFFMIILTPISAIFSGIGKLMSKLFKADDNQKMSQEELLMFVSEVEEEGSIDEDGGDLLRNAIEFSERKAEDILTHRVDLEALPIDSSKEDFAKKFSETKYSRLLVYEESIDNIVGVLHQKDFYIDGKITPQPLSEIISEPVFIPESEKINRLLKLLQTEKSHIAVVLDEYGGTLGIVTMEDILEELVGEIWDEHDEVVDPFKETEPDTFEVIGSVDIDDFFDYFEIKAEEESESISLSGWVTEQLDKLPDEGDMFTYKNLEITVLATDSHCAETLRVVRLPEPEEDEQQEEEK